MPDVAVIILNYNVAGFLRECLKSVFASEGVSFDVLVVDNKSTDDSVEMVKAEFAQVALIESQINGGFPYGNNLALRRVLNGSSPSGEKPEYIILLNPDTVLPPRALADMVDYMNRHREAGVAGPKLVRKNGDLDLACRRSFATPAVFIYRISGLSKRFPRSKRFARYNLTYLDPDQETEVDSVCGAFMMVRREVVEQVGFLDENFFMYGEDLDWAYRIKQKGWKVLYNPRVTVLHYKGESSRQESEAALKAFYQAMLIFYGKHYQKNNFFLLNWFVLSAIHLRGALASAVNLLKPASERRVS